MTMTAAEMKRPLAGPVSRQPLRAVHLRATALLVSSHATGSAVKCQNPNGRLEWEWIGKCSSRRRSGGHGGDRETLSLAEE